MKRWQEKIPSINLALINLILIFLIVLAFIVGPTNKMWFDQQKVLNKVIERLEIDTCNNIVSYYFDKQMYSAQCTINEVEYYLFFDDNAILYDKIPVDVSKETEDYMNLLDQYSISNSSYHLIYYKNKIGYWIKSKQGEYIFDYSSLDVMLKVRF